MLNLNGCGRHEHRVVGIRHPEQVEHVERVGQVSVDHEVTWDWAEGGRPVDGSKDCNGFIEEDVEGEMVM